MRKGRAWSMCWCHHRAAPCIGIHLKRGCLKPSIDMFVAKNNNTIKIWRQTKHYPWIRLPNPTFCGLPCMIARCAPHLSRVAAGLAPYRVELSSWEGVTGMIWREGHDRFLWIIIPLHWVSLMRPSSIIFLWQNVSPMHSVFLLESTSPFIIIIQDSKQGFNQHIITGFWILAWISISIILAKPYFKSFETHWMNFMEF